MNTNVKKNGSIPEMAEQWSLLVDGALSDAELDALLTQCKDDEALVADWQVYHVIGDVLRSSDLAQAHTAVGSQAYLESFRARLQQEPVIVAPVPMLEASNASNASRSKFRLHWPHWTGWLAASGFVVMAVVGVVYTSVDEETFAPAGQTVALQSPASTAGGLPENVVATASLPDSALMRTASVQPAQSASVRVPVAVSAIEIAPVAPVGTPLAQRPNIRLVSTPHGDMWRDQRLDPYLSAHQQFGNGPVFGDVSANGYMRSSAIASGSVKMNRSGR